MQLTRFIAFTLFALSAAARGDVKPAALFSDHAVLQSGMPVPIWGTADPAEKVSVTFNGQTRLASAGPDGKWMVKLSPLKPGGPSEMTIAGKNVITVHDVLVGEVWVGSGQSNMAFPISKAHASYAGMVDEDKVIAAADFPQLRMFTGANAKTYEPQSDIAGHWLIANPANAGDFSAVAYLFGRDLHQALRVPVGMLTLAFGGSTAESWVPREALVADPQLKPLVDNFDAREAFFKAHPTATDDQAPAAPQTINARPGKPGPLRDPVQDQHQPTVLFNGMINPVIPYAIRGVIWYQGESIVGGKPGVLLYPHVMETLVTDWRRRWAEGNFPFYVVQLAALKNASNNPVVREQQAAILALPNTGMAVTIDVGDPANVHPKNKEPVGARLSRIALANVYGHKIEFAGPTFVSMKAEGAAIRVRFSHARGLIAKGTPSSPIAPGSPTGPGGFEIAGADQKFVAADAKIEGDSVVVRSAAVAAPVAVRYAWANYPESANLYNSDGLPAAPFRTDRFDALAIAAAEFTGK